MHARQQDLEYNDVGTRRNNTEEQQVQQQHQQQKQQQQQQLTQNFNEQKFSFSGKENQAVLNSVNVDEVGLQNFLALNQQAGANNVQNLKSNHQFGIQSNFMF